MLFIDNLSYLTLNLISIVYFFMELNFKDFINNLFFLIQKNKFILLSYIKTMNIVETIQKNDILKVLLILAGVYFFMTYYYKEALENVSEATVKVAAPVTQVPVTQAAPGSLAVGAPTGSAQEQQVASVVAGSTQLTTSDLLPKYDDASDFAKQNPVSKILQEQNFLQAGYHIGINTTIQSNKIPYLDIRSCPPIPKQEAGPWNQSTFEEPAGAKRRYLEIGN